MDQTFQLFSKCVLFRNLERREKDALFTRVRIRDFAANETIFLMGSPGDSMMIVLDGGVQIGVPSPKGQPYVLAILAPGEIFGEIALLDGRARSADAIAITACSLATIARRDYLAFLEQNPGAWQNTVSVLCERLRKTDGHVAEIALLHDKNWQLAEASQHKSRFLAAASHDLRQPMHALGLFVAQLRSHITSSDGSRLVNHIDDAMTGLNELFNALLDITKLDAGAVTPTIGEFPIAELLGRIGSTFVPVAQEKGLSYRSVPSSAWVRSDRVLLERIVLNLVSNAVRYTVAGGIVVGCRHHDDHAHIEVWDSGPGIPPEQQRKIFEEFYRLPDVAKANQAGLGLGLAIVHRFCTLLDHPIRLTSTLGKGSRFSVTVPKVAARPRAQATAHPRHQATIDVAKDKLVVVIDDDAQALEGMAGLLRNWSCHVIAAASPEAVLTAVSHIGAGARPDLVITDYHLGNGQSGITAIAKLRKAYGLIPAFLMTADSAPERRREVQESGFHLLRKPVQPMTLRAMVSRFLKSAHA